MRRIVAGVLGILVVSISANAADLSPAANRAYLDSNGRKPGVVVMPGIQYRVLQSGAGVQPRRHDCARVHYVGSLIDGTLFDPKEQGQVSEATFEVSGVIGGWTQVLMMMREGDKWEVVIPAGLAYGKAGTADGVIPPDQTLVFQIELLGVTKPGRNGCG